MGLTVNAVWVYFLYRLLHFVRCNAFGYFGRVVVWVGVIVSKEWKRADFGYSKAFKGCRLIGLVYREENTNGGEGDGRREEETPSSGAII